MKMQAFQNLSDREKQLGLLAGAVIVLALFVVWQRGVKEVALAQAELGRAQSRAEQRATQLDPALVAPSVRSSPVALQDAHAPLLDGLAKYGLTLSRLNESDTRQIVLELDSGEPVALFRWLEDVEHTMGLRPSAVQLDAQDDGQVRAALTFVLDAP